MDVLNSFWVELLELIYLPIQSLVGFSPLLAFVVIAIFMALQLFIFYSIIVKPFVYLFKLLFKLPNLK